MAGTDEQIRRRLDALRKTLPRQGRPPARVPRPVRPASLGGRGRFRRRLAAWLLAATAFALVLPPFTWPLRGPVSSGFLFRLKPDVKSWSWEIHHGIDLAVARGTPVRAAALGMVSAAGRSPELGEYVRVSHLFGFETLYAHLDRRDVRAGDLVVPGLGALGLSGNTGRTTGPHLHFGVFFAGLALPPEAVLVFHSLRRAVLGF